MEYIEREAFIKHLREDPLFNHIERYGITNVIESFPAADVAPVRRGEWEDGHSVVFCSVCGEQSEWRTPYCPNCGAKME